MYPRFFKSSSIAIAVVALTAHAACAQRPDLPAGTRIRVWSGPIIIGTLLRVQEDTLLLSGHGSQDTTRIALASATRIDISTHRDRHVVKGMAIGTVVGVVSGYAFITALGPPTPGGGPFSTLDSGPAIEGVGGLVGAAIGGIVGAFWKTDHWTTVSPSNFRLSFRF
jgi:hypothetical protein